MFSNFHFLLFLFLKMFRFRGSTIINNVVVRQFKICPVVLVIVWTINQVKVDPLSRNLDMFLKQITLVRTHKVRFLLQDHIKIFLNLCLHSFSMSASISINLFLLKRSRFHDDTIVNSVAMLQFKVCLSI